MKWYTIGSFTFPASWAAIVAAFVLVLAYLTLQRKKQAADLYSNAFLTFVLTWKLSVILFQFSSIMKNPLSIIYFNGGIKGYFLGLAVAFLYVFGIRRKSIIQGKELHTEIWILLITIYELAFYLLGTGHTVLGGVQLGGGILFFILIKKKPEKMTWSRQILILFTCFQGLVYSMKGDLLSIPMITYITGALVLSLAISKERRETQ